MANCNWNLPPSPPPLVRQTNTPPGLVWLNDLGQPLFPDEHLQLPAPEGPVAPEGLGAPEGPVAVEDATNLTERIADEIVSILNSGDCNGNTTLTSGPPIADAILAILRDGSHNDNTTINVTDEDQSFVDGLIFSLSRSHPEYADNIRLAVLPRGSPVFKRSI